MITTQVNVLDGASPVVRDLAERLRSTDALNQVAGRAGVNIVKQWLRALDSSRENALRGTRTHFWAKAAAATGFAVTPAGADVYTEQVGVRYQRYGGTIVPSGRTSSVTGRAITRLAIPARSEAHGKTPGDFNDLAFGMNAAGTMWLERRLQQSFKTGRQRKDGSRKVSQGKVEGGEVMFWLVKSAQKGPDEGVLPPAELVADAVGAALTDFATRNARRLAAA